MGRVSEHGVRGIHSAWPAASEGTDRSPMISLAGPSRTTRPHGSTNLFLYVVVSVDVRDNVSNMCSTNAGVSTL